MATDSDNPCLPFEQDNLGFYQALLSDSNGAWSCLYIKAYKSFITYACQRSSISTDDALDILQDGLAEFAVKLKNGKYVFQGSAVTAYVFTVCRNRWVAFLRKNKIQKTDRLQDNTADDDDDDSTIQDGENHPFTIFRRDDPDGDEANEADSGGSDAIWADNEADWEAVGRAFAEVGADCQTMLNCFYVEEKSLGECGARIGLQENSAKVKRFRCAQRMKTLYTQYKKEEGGGRIDFRG
ncbi:MAG: sigma-70 family RNA polymerase sigma factor [Cytophagaceae bacterium]|nr:sigma-70 family RNA polymerase sigma factor [Cytophagaceae bacterium]